MTELGAQAPEQPLLSLIVPLLNEEDVIPIFLSTVCPILDAANIRYEIIFIDDGSSDSTADVIRREMETNASICLICLSRNFGKEAALTAGLESARGDAVVPMDVDLQDPPELIPEFVRLWQEGYDVVYGKRVTRDSDTGMKRHTAGAFYRVYNALSEQEIQPNVGDFRLMNRAALDATLRLRERNRFMKGLFAWVGFRSIGIPYKRASRAAGTTKFNYWKLWNFALDGLTSFSTVPLRVWTYLGVIVACGAFVYTLVILTLTLLFGRDVPGYASLMVVILFLGGVQLISLGIIGEYLGRVYIESKQRPIYLIKEMAGFDEPKILEKDLLDAKHITSLQHEPEHTAE